MSLHRILFLGCCCFFIGNVYCLATTSSSDFSTNTNNWKHVISTNKNGGHSTLYTFHDGIKAFPPQQQRQLSPLLTILRPQQLLLNLKTTLSAVFLPSGYPQSTPSGYLQFSIFSWIQDLSTQLRGVLATQRILEGVGVGREGATALSALMNFLVRDGCGMFATLAFTATSASRFKADVKRWRLFADIMVDIGITLEVAAIQLPWFLPAVCLGNMCKAICGVAAGACGGAIHLHWAQGSDISDVAAKFGAQHTVTASLGLIFAALFVRSVSQVPTRQLWFLYSLLTAVHLYANAKCMRLMSFSYFNTERFRIALQEFWDRRVSREGQEKKSGTISTPEQIAKKEPLLFWPTGTRKAGPSITFGAPFSEWVNRNSYPKNDLEHQLETDQARKYSVLVSPDRRKIGVFLHHGISPADQAKAYFHADMLRRRLVEQKNEESSTVEAAVAHEVDDAWNDFEAATNAAGWDLRRTELQNQGYEIQLTR